MTTRIHPTALVDPKAELGEGVCIGPYCVVDAKVRLGAGTVLESFVRVADYVEVGENCRLFDHVVLGRPPQDFGFREEETWVRIGNGVTCRENVTIHRASGEGHETRVGEGCYLMEGCHLGHNVVLGDHCVLANKVGLAGYAQVGDRVTFGGMAGVHQFVHIGRSCMVGGLSKIVKDVPPFCMVDGRPGRIFGLNRVGLRRQGFDGAARKRIGELYETLRTGSLPLRAAVEALASRNPQDPYAQELLAFSRICARGWTPWAERRHGGVRAPEGEAE